MTPVDIKFHSLDPSPALEEWIRAWATRVGRPYDDIERCAVVIDLPHRRHSQGNTFAVRVYITVPERTIAISRDPGRDHEHENVYAAVADAFRAARRALQDHMRIRRGDVKLHA
jgi:hypothetical protein